MTNTLQTDQADLEPSGVNANPTSNDESMKFICNGGMGNQVVDDAIVRDSLHAGVSSYDLPMPELGHGLNSQLSSELNPELNHQLNSELNDELNRELNDELDHELNPELNGDFNDELNPPDYTPSSSKESVISDPSNSILPEQDGLLEQNAPISKHDATSERSVDNHDQNVVLPERNLDLSNQQVQIPVQQVDMPDRTKDVLDLSPVALVSKYEDFEAERQAALNDDQPMSQSKRIATDSLLLQSSLPICHPTIVPPDSTFSSLSSQSNICFSVPLEHPTVYPIPSDSSMFKENVPTVEAMNLGSDNLMIEVDEMQFSSQGELKDFAHDSSTKLDSSSMIMINSIDHLPHQNSRQHHLHHQQRKIEVAGVPMIQQQHQQHMQHHQQQHSFNASGELSFTKHFHQIAQNTMAENVSANSEFGYVIRTCRGLAEHKPGCNCKPCRGKRSRGEKPGWPDDVRPPDGRVLLFKKEASSSKLCQQPSKESLTFSAARNLCKAIRKRENEAREKSKKARRSGDTSSSMQNFFQKCL